MVFLLVSLMLKAIYLASLLCGRRVTSGSSVVLCTVPVPGGPWPRALVSAPCPAVPSGAQPGSSKDEQSTPRAAPAHTGNARGRADGHWGCHCPHQRQPGRGSHRELSCQPAS